MKEAKYQCWVGENCQFQGTKLEPRKNQTCQDAN